MNIREYFTITENVPVARDVFRMRLAGNTAAFSRPGQFLNIALDGLFLRRPISVADYDADGVLLYYKVVGEGTRRMSAMTPGAVLDVLTGLGNGFDVGKSGARPLVVGGGVGAPPLYRLTRELCAAGKTPRVILGFNAAQDVFLVSEFEALGVRVTVATADGSAGVRGFVTDRCAKRVSYMITSTPAVPSRCSARCTTRRTRPGSTALRRVWAAVSVPAWDAAVRPNTAINASAATARCLKRRRSYGRHACDFKRADA